MESGLSDAVVLKKLQSMMRRKLKQTGRAQVFLELFAGTAVFSRQVQACSGFGCLSLDLRFGDWMDLSREVVMKCILGWISSRLVRGVWVGLPWDVGPRLLCSSRRCLELCGAVGVPFFLEAADAARALLDPPLAKALSRWKAQPHVLDFCQFSAPWQRRTVIIGVCTGFHSALHTTCSGKFGRCSAGRFHIPLRGVKPGTGILWVRIAEPYPRRLARVAAAALTQAADAIHLEHLGKLAGGDSW